MNVNEIFDYVCNLDGAQLDEAVELQIMNLSSLEDWHPSSNRNHARAAFDRLKENPEFYMGVYSSVVHRLCKNEWDWLGISALDETRACLISYMIHEHKVTHELNCTTSVYDPNEKLVQYVKNLDSYDLDIEVMNKIMQRDPTYIKTSDEMHYRMPNGSYRRVADVRPSQNREESRAITNQVVKLYGAHALAVIFQQYFTTDKCFIVDPMDETRAAFILHLIKTAKP